MDDWGISAAGFRRPGYTELLDAYEQQAKAKFGNDINLSVRSILGLMLRIYAWFSSLMWQLAEDVYNAGYVDTATGISLARIGAIIGIRPYIAAKAMGELTFTGEAGAIIPAGMIAAATNRAQFITLSEAKIGNDGTATVSARAYDVGPDGNAATATITTIVTPIADIDTVTNAAAFEGGRNRETEAEFRARYYRSVKRVSGANTDAIREEILTVPGVQHAIVYENCTDSANTAGLPAHSIEAVVLGGQDMAIARAIWARKAAGIQTYGSSNATVIDASGNNQTVNFSRPNQVAIYVRIADLQIKPGYTAADVQNRIKAALISYIGALGVGGGVYYTRLIEQVNKVEGVTDYRLTVSNNGTAYGIANIGVSSRQTAYIDGDKVVFS